MMLAAIVDQVTALAEGGEVVGTVVGRVMVDMSAGQDHPRAQQPTVP
jgi:hypothetical protein